MPCHAPTHRLLLCTPIFVENTKEIRFLMGQNFYPNNYAPPWKANRKSFNYALAILLIVRTLIPFYPQAVSHLKHTQLQSCDALYPSTTAEGPGLGAAHHLQQATGKARAFPKAPAGEGGGGPYQQPARSQPAAFFQASEPFNGLPLDEGMLKVVDANRQLFLGRRTFDPSL